MTRAKVHPRPLRTSSFSGATTMIALLCIVYSAYCISLLFCRCRGFVAADHGHWVCWVCWVCCRRLVVHRVRTARIWYLRYFNGNGVYGCTGTALFSSFFLFVLPGSFVCFRFSLLLLNSTVALLLWGRFMSCIR